MAKPFSSLLANISFLHPRCTHIFTRYFYKIRFYSQSIIDLPNMPNRWAIPANDLETKVSCCAVSRSKVFQ